VIDLLAAAAAAAAAAVYPSDLYFGSFHRGKSVKACLSRERVRVHIYIYMTIINITAAMKFGTGRPNKSIQ